MDKLTEQLAEISGTGVTAGMTPPSRWNYATYEDYAAAYQAYIEGISQGTAAAAGTEAQALLSRYGFTSDADAAERSAELTRRNVAD